MFEKKKSFSLCRMFLFTLALSLGLLSTVYPAFAQQRGNATSHPNGRWSPSRFDGTPHVSTSPFTGQDHSGDNWAGFTVGSGSGNGFKGVEANWNAECTSGSTDSNHLFGSWVGLGGYFFGDNLEQAGIALQTDGTYRLFWEYVWGNGDPPYYDWSDVVHCGDHITAWVHYGSSYCSNGGFYAHVQDNSTGAHLGSTCLTKSQGYGIQSGDWIDERPFLSCGGPSYLADFNWTDWSNVLAQANFNGAGWANPNSFVNTKVYMHDFTQNKDISYPDQASVNSNNTFTGRWHGSGTYCD
ncbi:MAG TPA: G1 family glutamic endopeptidase [Ktedonobacteraceae bacterium]|nr:G1 family glutamic endopeptidase [Ktedonobacteraceae bacterium]